MFYFPFRYNVTSFIDLIWVRTIVILLIFKDRGNVPGIIVYPPEANVIIHYLNFHIGLRQREI